VEPGVEFIVGNLSVAVFVEPGEGFIEGVLVEGLVATDLAVELDGDFVDFVFLKETGVVFVERGEKFFDDFLEFCWSD